MEAMTYTRKERTATQAVGDVLTSRPVFYGIVVLIVVIVVVASYELLNETFTRTSDEKLQDSLKDEIVKEQLSHPLSQYGIWASILKKAMVGWGTNETAIYGIMSKMNTDSDVKQLYSAFGIQYYEDKLDFGLSNADYDLAKWLEEELRDSEKNKINNLFATKGITYQITI